METSWEEEEGLAAFCLPSRSCQPRINTKTILTLERSRESAGTSPLMRLGKEQILRLGVNAVDLSLNHGGY